MEALGCEWAGLLLLQCVAAQVLVADRTVSLAFGNSSRFSSALWLKPAHCLFEDWLGSAADKTLANRETAVVRIEVMKAGDATGMVYQSASVYPIPHCDFLFSEPSTLSDAPYRLGPELRCVSPRVNQSCVSQIFPGQAYRVRYAVSSTDKVIVVTPWSEPLWTRGEVMDNQSLSLNFSRSGGMIALAVLISLAMVTLVIMAILTVIKQHM
ncbi:uncharacterized protein LOC136752943 [Amia ocellicauda]|uniref:uncharacterized protein LOC136752943 n=1 Tax=Amia ocellicauda TaxID=2972642 RepID=UPI003464DACA